MHDNFADWYRIISIDPQQINLDARWRSIETYSRKLTKYTALDVVRRMFGEEPKATDFDQKFRNAFKKTDTAFPMRDNALEMSVLAAATAANLLDADDKNLSDAAALAIVCADFQGLRGKIPLYEIVELAQTYLNRRSNDIRSQWSRREIPMLTAKAPVLTGDATPVLTIAEVAKMVQPALEKLNALPNELVSPFNDALVALEKQLFLQQEESDMLWWLFASHSRDLRKSIAHLGLAPASVIAGKELADLTTVLPGPVAAAAFLDKMLVTAQRSDDSEDITVREAVSAEVLRDWKTQLTKSGRLDSLDDFCSLNFVLRQSTETENTDEWATKCAKHTHIQVDDKMPPSALALQMYRERLLMKAMQS